MGVKVAVTKPKSKAITKFPCIGITGIDLKDSSLELVVLFEHASKGTVLQSNSYEIGHISSSWKMEIFTLYDGTVRLSNN